LVEQDSAQRAKGEIRRQIRANRGRYLWTFTYAKEQFAYEQLVKHVAAFQRRLRQALGKVWLLLVPEPHPGGHGWHLHGAAATRLPIKTVRKCWGQGHVWVGDHKREHRTWSSRHLSRYLAKYATKMVGGGELYGCRPRPRGAHRYWVTQGYEPEKVSMTFRSVNSAHRWLMTQYGCWDDRRRLELGADVPVEGWWLSFGDECLASPPGG
jgi:hypothetical protein